MPDIEKLEKIKGIIFSIGTVVSIILSYSFYYGYFGYFGIDIRFVNIEYIDMFISILSIFIITIIILFIIEFLLKSLIESKIVKLIFLKFGIKPLAILAFLIILFIVKFLVNFSGDDFIFLIENFYYLLLGPLILIMIIDAIIGKCYGSDKLITDLEEKYKNGSEKIEDDQIINNMIAVKLIFCMLLMGIIVSFVVNIGKYSAETAKQFQIIEINNEEYIIFSLSSTDIITKKIHNNLLQEGIYILNKNDVYNRMIIKKEIFNLKIENKQDALKSKEK